MNQKDYRSENWKTAYQELMDGVLVVSESNQILFSNEAFSKYFGRKQQEMIGKNFIRLLNETNPNLSKNWQELIKRSAGDKKNNEYVLKLKIDNKARYFSVSATHYEHGPYDRYAISIWRDISERELKTRAKKQPGAEQTNQNERQIIITKELAESDNLIGNHAREITAINKIAQKVHASLSVDEVVNITLSEFKAVLDIDLVFVFMREGDQLNLAGHVSDTIQLNETDKHWVGKCLCGLAAETNEIVHSDDIFTDNRCTLQECRNAGIKSLIAIPMTGQMGNLGVLGLGSPTEKKFSKQRIFLNAMVSQVSIALSNANLYEEARRKISEGMKVTGQLSNYQVQLEEIVRKRTEELRQQYQEIEKEVTERKRAVLAEREQRTLAVALEKSASILNSTLDLDEVLDSMLLALENVIPHDSANIMLIDSERNIATVARYKGNPKEKSVEAPPTSNFPIYETPTLFSMYQNKLPFVIKDVKTDSSWIAQIGSDWIRSYLAAPILFGDEVLGFLNLVSDTKNFYSQEDAGRLQAFANHASIAIRNARLYDQAGDVAVLEERQRLARDMHDAVSQTLFTANVIAEALPLQWERDPMKGKEGLTKIKQLIQGALAEMRTLLVELRPDAISKSDLGDLINQIALGAMSYIEITPSIHISGRFPLPDDVQLALFRITQEIFNNISKHARANHVIVDFKNKGDEVTLRVEDDGRGFDPDEIKTGRLGISIMRERATSIGASLTINSQPGDGTIVQVQWRRPEEETIEK